MPAGPSSPVERREGQPRSPRLLPRPCRQRARARFSLRPSAAEPLSSSSSPHPSPPDSLLRDLDRWGEVMLHGC